jgi:two-component system nitrate/nitrite response regulator NarL
MPGVLIVSDTRLYRDSLAEQLDRAETLEIVGAAADAQEAVTALRTLRPEVVLLDLAMCEPVSAAYAIRSVAPEAKIVAIAVPDERDCVVACAEAGVIGYVTQEGSLADLLAALEAAVRGEPCCPPRLTGILLRRVTELAQSSDQTPFDVRLTTRELEIVELLDQALSNKEIAKRLSIEVATVKNHVHNILEKLHVARRSEVRSRLRSARSPVLRFDHQD